MTRWTPLLVATILSMTAPAFSQDKVVHFSSINGQTGQSAAYGSKVIEGVNLAAKAINDAGGFADKCGARYKVKITTGDMANSREQAVSLLRQAAADASVLAVVAPSPSTGYVPMVPVAGQLKIPIIATGSAAPIKEWNPWAFRLNTVSKVAVPPLMRTLKAKFDVKRVALVYDVTQDGQRGEAELIKNAAKDVGYEVVAFEAFRAGDNDFRPQLSKIKAVKPDGPALQEGVRPRSHALLVLRMGRRPRLRGGGEARVHAHRPRQVPSGPQHDRQRPDPVRQGDVQEPARRGEPVGGGHREPDDRPRDVRGGEVAPAERPARGQLSRRHTAGRFCIAAASFRATLRPVPDRPRSLPRSTTTWPRSSTISGQPWTSQPSQAL